MFKKKWLAEREGFTDNQGLLSVLTIISRSYEKVEVKINDKSRIPLAPGFFLNTNLKVVLIMMQFLDFTNTKNVKNYENKFLSKQNFQIYK